MTLKRKILLFGSTGFIGHNLHDYFQSKNKYEIVSPTRKECDLLDQTATYRFVHNTQPQFIINAAFIGVGSNIKYTDDYLYNNLRIVTNVLESAKAVPRLKKIIFFGSSLEYKDSGKAVNENHPLEAKNAYAIVKMMCSLLSLNLSRQWQLLLILLRPFNLYGKYDTKSVIYYLTSSIIEKKPITITKGEQVRDYLYIGDFTRILYQVLENHQLFNNHEAYNIGAGKPTKLNSLFKTIFKAMNYEGKYKLKQYPENEYWYNVADNKKISKLISLASPTSLEKGIEQTIGWIKSTHQ